MGISEIYMISHRDLLKGRSDCISIVRMAYSFSKMEIKVKIIMPYFFRKENIKLGELWDYYGIKRDAFSTITLPTPLWDNAPKNIKRAVKLIFHTLFILYLIPGIYFSSSVKVFYLRGVIECIPYIFLKKIFPDKILLVYDLYDLGSKSKIHRVILRNSDLIVSITNSLKEKLMRFYNVDENKIVVFGIGISEEILKKKIKASRENLKLPVKKPIATYTGKIYKGQREIEYLLKAAKSLPEVIFLFIGGKKKVVEYYKKWCQAEKIENVIFKGFLPPSEVLKYQRVSDVLLLFYTKDIPTFDVCSPSKLFEYMASGVPIIAVNSPSISEIIKDMENGILVEAENLEDLTKKIKMLLSDRALGQKLASKALEDVKNYTYEKRANFILNSLQKSVKTK